MKQMLQEWGQFTYIPDLRQLNAVQTYQQKDERAAKVGSLQRLRSQKSLKKLDRDQSGSRNETSFQLTDAPPIQGDFDSSGYEL